MDRNIKIAKELVRLARSLVANQDMDFYTPEEMVEFAKERLSLSEEDAEKLLHDINNLRGDEWFEEFKNDKELLDAYKAFLNRYCK